MPQTFNSDIFRVATAFEAAKGTRTVEPEAAAAVKTLGRARFYDALAGRYGLPGAIYESTEHADTRDMSGNPVADYFDLRAMTFSRTTGLAEMLNGAGRLGREDSDLLAYRLGALSYSSDSIFSTSPVARFARQLSDSRRTDRTTDLIVQQESQLRYLSENNADPRAIRGARNVLSQLRQLQIEQSLYAQFDSARDRRTQGRSGLGPFGAAIDMMSFPASALGLLSQK